MPDTCTTQDSLASRQVCEVCKSRKLERGGSSRSLVMSMARKLVRGRNGEKQRPHRCVACGNTGHRVETCGTEASRVIRQLRSKLANALQTKSRKESKLRPVRKDGSHRARAHATYTGTQELRVALVKREAVLEQRRCFEKSERRH